MAIVINGSGTVTGISVGGLPDDIVDAGTLADNAVGLAQMAGGTDGNIITYDASGNPAVIATGTRGHFLKSAGAGAAPTFADAGNSKNGLITLDVTTATGTVAVTSLGFTPKNIIFFAVMTTNMGNVGAWGMLGNMTRGVSAYVDYEDVYNYNAAVQIRSVAGAHQQIDLSSLDSDGFTLSHIKTGSPTGTAGIFWMAFG